MQLKPADIGGHLAGGSLAPVYLVSGDETLLVEETCDAIIAAARAAGFTERDVMHVERGFRWHEITNSAAAMSLFSDRKIIDVRVPDAKFDKDGAAVLREYTQAPPTDNLLLLRCSRLDPRQRQSAWFKALDASGVIVLVWPVGIGELPRWLQGRLRQQKLQLTPAALEYFVERIEGNLLAAVQEIDKLRLAELPTPIDLPDLMSALSDASHYDVFEYLDAILAGDGPRVARMVTGMQAEGVALFAILGALGNLIRALAEGRKVPGPPQRARLAERFTRRVPRDVVTRALGELALIDAQGKGALRGDAWQSLARLSLLLAAGTDRDRLPTLHDYHAQLAWR